MGALSSSDLIAAWADRMQDAADRHPAVAFDGRVSLPAWLVESARDQAERIFLALDATPVEARDMALAERMLGAAGTAFLEAWGWAMAAFGSDDEPWAKDAADLAALAYRDRLDDLAPGMNAGGRA